MKDFIEDQIDRVRAFLPAARRIADPSDPLGISARRLLPESTGLSAEGVDYALLHCLELEATEAELEALCRSVPSTPKAHVLLSANVFVAAYRALAVAFASSESVAVRPSRREPTFVELLRKASALPFEIVDELMPAPRESVWAYGRDKTLEKVRDDLPSGVIFHRHGSGLGAAVVDTGGFDTTDLEELASNLALDISAFDQRGCLSPRFVLLLGDDKNSFASMLARALSRVEHEMPRGVLSDNEHAAISLYRDSIAYAGTLYPAGKGFVGLDEQSDRVLLPPVGRVVHLSPSERPLALLHAFERDLTCIGAHVRQELKQKLQTAFPRARITAIGRMQRPALDGPVDRRTPPEGEIV